MHETDSVYDLGEIRLDEPRNSRGSVGSSRVSIPSASAPVSYGRSPRASGPGPGLTGSLSLFVPGAGQIVAGEATWGFFFLTSLGFVAAVAWALVVALERLVPTLDILGVPRIALVATFGALAACACALHISAASQAHALRDDGGSGRAAHPVVAGLASALLPGWGQLLVGHRMRGALFLFAAWSLGLLWLAVNPAVAVVLEGCGFPIPPVLREGWGPAAMIAVPIALWAVGIYDAVAGAVASRT